jgi:single-stranded-DNA-specific exonuclease
MLNRKWVFNPLPDKAAVEKLSAEINVSPSLAGILINRGIHDFEQARRFFRPDLNHLNDPFEMRDMEQAVERLNHAIKNGEKILVYGDYDVDGTTAVSVVYSYLKKLKSDCYYYIPDRNKEGYGVSEAGINWAIENRIKLIIALDLGIKAGSMVEKAAASEIDFIICDHHEPDTELPNAIAVLDPKRPDCSYPFKELSGCGIGFKLLQGYASRYGTPEDILEFLDLVAVSIASDIVPVTGENRILAFHGLNILRTHPRPGLKALIEISGSSNQMNISDVVFTIGPRINAAGRIAHAHGAVELLIAQTDEEARVHASSVNLNNSERRGYDLNITEEALAMIEGSQKLLKSRSTVLYKAEWHKGVIGIVASRVLEKHYKPTIILTRSNGKLTGSARSVDGFDLYAAIESCGELLEKFGGHKYAAGLTLDESNLEAFIDKFEQVVSASITAEMLQPALHIDAEIKFDQVNRNYFNILKQMAPFGPQNLQPVFVSKAVMLYRPPALLKEKHVKFSVVQDNIVLNAISFGRPELYEMLMKADKPFNIAFNIEENTFNNVTSLQLRIKDIQFP